jgi:hypothetical protein
MADQSPNRKFKLFCKTSEASTEQVTCYKKIFFVLVLAIVLAVVLTSNVVTMSQQSVEAQLKSSSDSIARYARDNGSEASLTYGDIQLMGFGYEKYAHVATPTLSFTRSGWLGQEKIVLSSDSVLIRPDASNVQGFTLEFPEPITISKNGQGLNVLSFANGTPKYVYMPYRKGGEDVLSHRLSLPPEFTLTPPDGSGETISVTYDAAPKVVLLQVPATNHSESELEFHNITITDPGTVITAGMLTSILTRDPAEEGKLAFDSTIVINDIGYKRGGDLDGPYSLKFSGNGTRVIPVDGKLPPPDTSLNLRELSVSADKFRLVASGAINRTADDFMPHGKADVNIENFPSLLASDNLSPELKTALAATLSQVTGADAASEDALNFSVVREPMGEVGVGNVGLEDAITTFFTRMMLGGGEAPQPAPDVEDSPPADEPEEDAPLPEEEKPST